MLRKGFILWISLLYLIMIPPTIVDRTIIGEYDLYFRIAAIVSILYLYCKKTFSEKRIDFFLVAYNIFALILVYTSFANNANIRSAVWLTWINGTAIIMLVHWSIEFDRTRTLYAIFYTYFVLAILNIISIAVAPFDYGKGEMLSYYVLGNYNIFIRFYLFSLFTGYLLLLNGKRDILIPYIALDLVAIVSIYMAHAVTSLAVILVWNIYIIFIRGKYRKIFNIFTYTGVALIGLVGTVFAHNNKIFVGLTSLIGKSPTFSGRTKIWERSFEYIKSNVLFGNGVEKSMESATQKIGNIDCHNSYLQILYDSGLVGAMAFLSLPILCIRNMLRIRNSEIIGIMSIFLFCIMIEGLFETYKISHMMLNLSLIYFISKKEYENDKREN